jgi:hypothetical protein
MSLFRRVILNYVRFFQTLLLRKKKSRRKDENPFIYPHF